MAYDQTLFNRTPYYDDFNEDKKFLRMLFRPGYAVQARELTQAQTILQNQIQRFGDHIFEEGARVLGGEIASQNAYFLRIKRQVHDNSTQTRPELVKSDWEGFEITQENDGVTTRARVLEVIDPSGELDDYYVFIIQFISGSEFRPDTHVASSNPAHNRQCTVPGAITDKANPNDAINQPDMGVQGLAKVTSINDGIFYTSGYFVKNEFQSLSPYTKDSQGRRNFTYPTTVVGFEVQQIIVASDDDPTLRDPANGTYNYNAPGANRFKLNLKLNFSSADNHDNSKFIELLTYEEGKVTKQVIITEYSSLEDTLARRTFDESGSYTVRPFEIDIREHKLLGDNRGVYADGDEDKAVAVLNPGKAYIFGYEFETQAPEFLSIKKARDINHQLTTGDSVSVPYQLGQYCVGDVLGAINSNDTLEEPFQGWLKLNDVTGNNGTESKARVRFYVRQQLPDFGDSFVLAGTANIVHMEKDDHRWQAQEDCDSWDGENSPGCDFGTRADRINERRYSGMWRFYFDDIDRTPIESSNEGYACADLDLMVFPNDGGPITEVYMVLATDQDLHIYNSTEFDPETASPNQDIYARCIAGGQFRSFTNPDYNPDDPFAAPETLYYYPFKAAENNKFLHNDNETTSLVFDFPEASFTKDVNRLSYSTQVLIKIPADSIEVDQNTLSTINISLGSGEDQLPQGFKFFGAIPGGENQGTSFPITDPDKRAYYSMHISPSSIGGGDLPHNCPMQLDNISMVLDSSRRNMTITGIINTDVNGDSQGINPTLDYVLRATVVFDGEVDDQSTIRTKIKRTSEMYLGGRYDTNAYPPVGTLVTYGYEDQDDSAQNPNSGGFPSEDVATGQYYYELPNSDIHKIVSIQTDGGDDLMNDFILDNGQRDTEYDYGRLYIKANVRNKYCHQTQIGEGGRTTEDGPQVFHVNYEWMEHVGRGPLLVNSYINPLSYDYDEDAVDSTSGMRYSDIPVFTSPKTGETIQLSHAIDFRYVRPTKQGDTNTSILAYMPNPAGQSFTPRTTRATDEITADYTYFLPRIDKVVLTKRLSDEDTTFDILEGIPSLEPVAPDDREDSMTLYQLTIPPFTYNVEDIRTKYIENRRYTMRDIGKIEDRVSGLEYFSTLSDLEQQAASATLVLTKEVEGDEGSEKRDVIAFKSAILVDSFRGHGIGDVANNDYRCSIDFESGTLRPSFNADALKLVHGTSAGTNGITIDANHICRIDHGSTITYLEQLQTSDTKKANPFYLTNWMGKIDLEPYGDYWWDTNYRPVIKVNTIGEADAWKSVEYSTFNAGKGFGSQWNDWQSMWHGLEVSSDDDSRFAVNNSITTPRSKDTSTNLPKRFEDNDQSVSRTTESIAQKKTRIGINIRSIPDRIKKFLGNRVVDVSIMPFVRPLELTINAHGLKPNTNVYCFFDGVNVTESCTINGAGPTGGVWRTGVDSDAGRISNMKFTIPAGRYEAGEKQFRIIDESNNDVEFATTAAESTFYSQGLKLSRDSGAVSIRPPVLRRQTVSSERLVTNAFSRETVFDNNSNTQYIDPLAQTFTIPANEYPGGMMLDAIEVFFAKKHTDLPVTLQIRPTVQGSPHSSIIIPFSEVVKYPPDISLNDTAIGATNATRFEFTTPVFLEPGEYALCFVTNTGDYELMSARVGDFDIATGDTIVQRQYVNDLYEPQNGSVALPSSTEDLAFRIIRANYDLTTRSITFENTAIGATTDVDMVYLNAKDLQLAGTSTNYTLTLSGTSNSSFSEMLNKNTNTPLDERRQINNAGTAKLFVEMTSQNSHIGPMLDVSQSSLITVKNNVSDVFDTETEEMPEAMDDANGVLARYITRRVNLPTTSSSNPNQMRVIFNKAGSGDVEVFMKALSGQESKPFDECAYTKLVKLEENEDHLENDRETFTELSFGLPEPNDEEERQNPFADTNGYVAFAIKVCMMSSDATNPPIIKDLRAIALNDPDLVNEEYTI